MQKTIQDYLEKKIKQFIEDDLPDEYLDQWVSLYFSQADLKKE
jgi:hypothetical protein